MIREFCAAVFCAVVITAVAGLATGLWLHLIREGSRS